MGSEDELQRFYEDRDREINEYAEARAQQPERPTYEHVGPAWELAAWLADLNLPADAVVRVTVELQS